LVIITTIEVIMNLLQFLKENEEARRVFGKRELKIIEKQLQGISLTQSEKNRLSRDIRKKFKFIKDVARFENEFELKKAQIVKDLINEAKEEILHHSLKNKIKKIFLYGSVVKNEISIKSDIDIVVEFDEITLKEATKFRIEMSGRISDKINIQVFNILPEKIKKSILNNHRILYSN